MRKFKRVVVGSALLVATGCSAESSEPTEPTRPDQSTVAPAPRSETSVEPLLCYSSLGQVAVVDRKLRLFRAAEIHIPDCEGASDKAPIFARDTTFMTRQARIVGWLAKDDEFEVTCLDIKPGDVGVSIGKDLSGLALHEHPAPGYITDQIGQLPHCELLPPQASQDSSGLG